MPEIGLKSLFAEAAAMSTKGRGLKIEFAGLSCPRDVFYRSEGHTKAAAVGIVDEAFSKALNEIAERSAVDVLTHRSVKIGIGGVRANGSADAVFVDENGPALACLFRIASDESWASLLASPHREHSAEANLIAYGLGAPKWSICYCQVSTGEMVEHFGATDPLRARRDFGLLQEVGYWIRVGIPPPRPFDDAPGRPARDVEPCLNCPSRATCWPVSA